MNEQPHDPPSDLTAVAADDALLDALPDTPPEDSDVLTQVLAAWRREIDDAPFIRVLDTDTALAVIAHAQGLPPRQGLLARLRAWLRSTR